MDYIIKIKEIYDLYAEGKTLAGLREVDTLLSSLQDQIETHQFEALSAYLVRAKILTRIGKYPDAKSCLETLLGTFSLTEETIEDPKFIQSYIESKILLSRILLHLGDLFGSRQYIEEATKESELYKVLITQLQAIHQFAILEWEQGDNFERAYQYVMQGISLSKFLADPSKARYWENQFFSARSLLDYTHGRYQEAIVVGIQTISHAKETHDIRLEGIAHNNLALVYRNIGEFELALEQTESAIEIARKLDYHSLLASSIGNMGLVFVDQGDFETGLDLLNQSLAIRQESNDLLGQAKTLGEISKSLASLGDRLKAKETFRETLKLYEQMNIKNDLVDKLCGYIDLLLETETLVEAEKYLNQAEEIVKKHKSQSEEIKLLIRKGVYLKALGKNEEARELIAEARTQAETIDQYKDTILASIYLAELDLERAISKGFEKSVFKDAFANVEKAYYLSERTGLFPFLVRTLIIKGSLLGARLEFQEALATLQEATRLANDKDFRLLHRQALELAERLKDRQKFIRPEGPELKELGMQEVLSYIRLMTGRRPQLPANAEHLESFYMFSYLIEVSGTKVLYYDPVPNEVVPENRNFDPLIMGMFFSGILGGNSYNEGLFGPIPTPDLKEFQALAYTKTLAPITNENPSGSYSLVIIAYPKFLDPLFYNRFAYETVFNTIIGSLAGPNVKAELTNSFFVKLKNELKEIIHKQVSDRTGM